MNTVINSNSINIAIDWDPTALHLRYQSTREKVSVDLHFHDCSVVVNLFKIVDVDRTWFRSSLSKAAN